MSSRGAWTAARGWHALLAAFAALVLWHAWTSQFNHDEIVHLHASWLVAQGQLPFADFLEQHHPTLWYLFAPAVGWFGSVQALVFAARLFDLACLAVCISAFVRLLRRVWPQAPVRWPVLLLLASFMFVRNSMEVRPDPLMLALVYLGLLHWVAFLQEARYRSAVAAGACFGAAAAVLQKALVVLALVGFASLLLAGLRRGGRARLLLGSAAMALVAALPLAALFAYVSARGYWKDFWFWNYPFNRFFYLQAEVSTHFTVLVTLGLSLVEDPVLWAAGGAGVFIYLRDLIRERRWSSESEAPRIGLVAVAAGYFAFLCLNRFPLEQYFLVLLPLLALFSAEVFVRVAGGRARTWLERSSLVMPAVLASILLFHPRNRPQRDVQDYVLARTQPAETLFVPPAYNPVFRRDSAYFWYNGALIGKAYGEYCRIHPDCLGGKLELDERRWSSEPPVFVYLELPEYFPVNWTERSRRYEETPVPRLLRLRQASPGTR